MPTNTDAPGERIISDFNRDLFGNVYFTTALPNGDGHVVTYAAFPDTDSIRRFASDLITEANRFDASGA